ncbi:hypothetical protein E6O75_ATG10476 [Venturia nashicola]|uniref:Uncharacterized protein n=1 Tax=Venturia nashicola TaxID=86259 RepID=A0A4Z1NTH6_9PEZI|nr:hypothetical protein E6O75_ATG10476 [Venturia nashicola]
MFVFNNSMQHGLKSTITGLAGRIHHDLTQTIEILGFRPWKKEGIEPKDSRAKGIAISVNRSHHSPNVPIPLSVSVIQLVLAQFSFSLFFSNSVSQYLYISSLPKPEHVVTAPIPFQKKLGQQVICSSKNHDEIHHFEFYDPRMRTYNQLADCQASSKLSISDNLFV